MTYLQRPLTPSAAHNEAYVRDAGHDRMQQDFLAFLRSRRLVDRGPLVHREVEAEMPLYRRGQIVAYADAAEMITTGVTKQIHLYEIKPKIHTVFGIVRQAKALLDLAKTIEADCHCVHVVVPHTDPLICQLKGEWPHVWAWGVTFDGELATCCIPT